MISRSTIKLGFFAATVLFCVLQAAICQASNTATLTVTAAVDSSASLSISDNAGAASTLNFSGYGNESVPASEGDVTVTARVSTTYGNENTVIQVKSTDLIGETPGDVIPASNLSYSHTVDSGGATWFSGALTSDWTTLANLTAGSGLYTGDQLYSLYIPASANDDTYTATISYQIIGF